MVLVVVTWTRMIAAVDAMSVTAVAVSEAYVDELLSAPMHPKQLDPIYTQTTTTTTTTAGIHPFGKMVISQSNLRVRDAAAADDDDDGHTTTSDASRFGPLVLAISITNAHA
jgi:hypothetical protein